MASRGEIRAKVIEYKYLIIGAVIFLFAFGMLHQSGSKARLLDILLSSGTGSASTVGSTNTENRVKVRYEKRLKTSTDRLGGLGAEGAALTNSLAAEEQRMLEIISRPPITVPSTSDGLRDELKRRGYGVEVITR
jgi:hypothetical protein